MAKRPINKDDDSSSDEWTSNKSSSSKQVAKKPKTKASTKEKGKSKTVVEDDGVMDAVEDGLPSLQYREGQKISLLELPVTILEQIFSLEQDLDLNDHVSISTTCWYLRNAYKDEEDDSVWRSVWMLRGPGFHETEPRISDTYRDLHNGSWRQRVKVYVTLPGERVLIPKAQHCLQQELNKGADHTYSDLRFSNAEHTPLLSPGEALSKLVAEWNELAVDTPQKATLKRLELIEVQTFNRIISNLTRRSRGQNWYRETEEQRKARIKKTKERAQGKMDEATLWQCKVSKFHLSRLPRGRRDLLEAGGDEDKLPLKAGPWTYSYGPWEILCKREVNFPITARTVAINKFLTDIELNQVRPVSMDLTYANTKSYYTKDIERLLIKYSDVIAERKATKEAEDLAREQKRQADILRYQQEDDLKYGPMCAPCRRRHKDACVHRAAISTPEKSGSTS